MVPYGVFVEDLSDIIDLRFKLQSLLHLISFVIIPIAERLNVTISIITGIIFSRCITLIVYKAYLAVLGDASLIGFAITFVLTHLNIIEYLIYYL